MPGGLKILFPEELERFDGKQGLGKPLDQRLIDRLKQGADGLFALRQGGESRGQLMSPVIDDGDEKFISVDGCQKLRFALPLNTVPETELVTGKPSCLSQFVFILEARPAFFILCQILFLRTRKLL